MVPQGISINATPVLYYAIITIPWLVGVVVLWALGRVVARVLDRRPRESVRCRRCWYDLRGITSQRCPECGADLHKGVWPPGKPVRRHLVNLLALWTGVVVTVAVPGAVMFYHGTHRVLVGGPEGSSGGICLVGPASQAYFYALADPMGSRIAWPEQTVEAVDHRTLRLYLWLGGSNGGLEFELDPDTLRVHEGPAGLGISPGKTEMTTGLLLEALRPYVPATKAQQSAAGEAMGTAGSTGESLNTQKLEAEGWITPPSLEEISPPSSGDTLEREVGLIMDAVRAMAGMDRLGPAFKPPDTVIRAVRSAEQPVFNPQRSWSDPSLLAEWPAPRWVWAVPAGVAATVWLLGVWLLHRAWRKHQLGSWPAAAPA